MIGPSNRLIELRALSSIPLLGGRLVEGDLEMRRKPPEKADQSGRVEPAMEAEPGPTRQTDGKIMAVNADQRGTYWPITSVRGG
jgi:hypothetical protein